MSPLHFRLTPPRIWPNIDWLLMLTAIALSIFGTIAVWGASASDGELGPLAGYARTQAQWIVLGVIAMIVLVCIDYRWSKRLAWVLYAGLLITLAFVIFGGHHIKGATSWFVFRIGSRKVSFQPSEPAKLIVIVVLARYLSTRMLTFRKIQHTFIPLMIVGLPMALILKQPDLGTSVVFVPPTFVMFYVAGLRKRVFILYFLLGVTVCGLAYPHLKPYQKDRIQTFLNPGQDALGKGYNVIQAQTALGSGGFLGKGWGRGTQTGYRFLPEYQTDFIFPTLGEQFGFVGCVVVLALYGLMIFRILYMAGRTPDLFGVLLLSGLATIIIVHIILNIGMATGMLPVTGLPLPFLSYGGSFVLTCFAMIGLIVSVGARRET